MSQRTARFPFDLQLKVSGAFGTQFFQSWATHFKRNMQAESDFVTRLRQQSVSSLAEKLAATNG